MNNYLKSKLKIFSLQNKNDFAYLPRDKDVIKRFKKIAPAVEPAPLPDPTFFISAISDFISYS